MIFLYNMVAHLRLRTHDLLNEEIGNVITDILSAREKAECYGKQLSNLKTMGRIEFTFISCFFLFSCPLFQIYLS